MTISQLISKLRKFPPDTEVVIDIGGYKAKPTDVDWEVSKEGTCVIIHDYHPHSYRKEAGGIADPTHGIGDES